MSVTGSPTRGYRSDLRRRQAAETRARIVAAAAELFGELGYAGTTLARIAERAQVSVETVQKAGPKAALMRAAVEVSSFGVEERSSSPTSTRARPFSPCPTPPSWRCPWASWSPRSTSAWPVSGRR
nr:hypothetical protein GCM10025730_17770 [Promicromonospora thailandica]